MLGEKWVFQKDFFRYIPYCQSQKEGGLFAPAHTRTHPPPQCNHNDKLLDGPNSRYWQNYPMRHWREKMTTIVPFCKALNLILIFRHPPLPLPSCLKCPTLWEKESKKKHKNFYLH